MNQLFRRAAALVATAALAACGTASASAPGASQEAGQFAKDSDTIVFGVVPDTTSTQDNDQPLADYIGKVLG